MRKKYIESRIQKTGDEARQETNQEVGPETSQAPRSKATRPDTFSRELTQFCTGPDGKAIRERILRETDITPAMLWQYQNNKARPTYEVLAIIARCCGVSMERLVLGSEASLRHRREQDPYYGYIEYTLATAQRRTDRQTMLLGRLAQVLSQQVAEGMAVAVSKAAELPVGPETFEVDEAILIELFSIESKVLTTGLVFDVPKNTEGEPVPGKFFDVVRANLELDRRYQFLLAPGDFQWAEQVNEFARLLVKAGVQRSQISANLEFRLAPKKAPIIAACAIYSLDEHNFQRQNSTLFERIRPGVAAGRAGFLLPPVEEPLYCFQMETKHLARASDAFEEIWSQSQVIEV